MCGGMLPACARAGRRRRAAAPGPGVVRRSAWSSVSTMRWLIGVTIEMPIWCRFGAQTKHQGAFLFRGNASFRFSGLKRPRRLARRDVKHFTRMPAEAEARSRRAAAADVRERARKRGGQCAMERNKHERVEERELHG